METKEKEAEALMTEKTVEPEDQDKSRKKKKMARAVMSFVVYGGFAGDSVFLRR